MTDRGKKHGPFNRRVNASISVSPGCETELVSKPSASAPRDKGEIGANLSVSVNQSLEEFRLKQAVLLNISRKCISSGQS